MGGSIKLSTILKEVSEQQSRDMVTGIADILRDVKDEGNRKEIAKRMIKKFDREGVKYNAEEFLKLCGVKNKMVREIELETTGTWEDYDLNRLDQATMQDMFKYYKNSYEAEGLDLSVNSPEELQSDYKAVAMIDVDKDKQPDSFIVYKPTQFGNKISLLFTNKAPGSARAAVTKMIELVNTSGWFLEGSKKTEEILSKAGAPVVTDEETIKAIIGPKKAKTMKMGKDGYYQRELGAVPGKFITKRIYGIPK